MKREGPVSAVAELRPAEMASSMQLPVLEPLQPLLSGLPRGAVVAVGAAPGIAGATTLSLAVSAAASQGGAWIAVIAGGGASAPPGRPQPYPVHDFVGRPERGVRPVPGVGILGLVAAAGLGVALDRLVVVAVPDTARAGWSSLIAALIDGFDLVLIGGRARSKLGPRDTRRLVARLRQHRGVIVSVGGDLPGDPARLRLTVTASHWEGPDQDAGYLLARRVTVEATGRGSAARPRRAQLWLPGPDGSVELAGPLEPADPLQAGLGA